MLYVTSFCNHAHDLGTGNPVGHECYRIPPAALQAEREERYADSQDIIARSPRVIIKGRAHKN